MKTEHLTPVQTQARPVHGTHPMFVVFLFGAMMACIAYAGTVFSKKNSAQAENSAFSLRAN